MLQNVFCAGCGRELEMLLKTAQGRVYRVVTPHSCIQKGAEVEERTKDARAKEEEKVSTVSLDQAFDKFKFVKKLNKLQPKQETSDRRETEHLRKELVTSSAPEGLLGLTRKLPVSEPMGDISEGFDE